ncbi:hypothetical protein Pan241w_01330 [Gimesia alba]|uniref:DUF1559 domain-containing protein n=1 Tax=Gimesia alba TaxID=2527973 RepID=A0A517R865_9PLAN|nr:DUF1559 domain-containing protein [Gimesia alba]QDT40080.1 hypothetical protein Pan241w_01330 [Gimesia alba]
MESEPVESSTKKNGVKIFLVSGSVLVLFICGAAFVLFLACMGAVFPLEILISTFAGWFLFLKRVIPQMTVSVPGLLSALVLSAIMVVVIQFMGRYFIRQFHKQNQASVPEQWRFRWTCAVLVLLVFSFAGGFAVVGVAYQSTWLMTSDKNLIQMSGWAMRRSTSKNNLKQIGLAMHHYHETHSRLPFGGTFDQTGRPQHSWATRLLPYLDQEPLYNQIDFNQPWTAEANRSVFETDLYFFENPGIEYAVANGKRDAESDQGYQPAHYAANSHVLNVNSGLSFKEIKDGTSYTLLAGEVKSGIKAWGDPTNFRDPMLGINQSPRGFGSPYQGGAHFLLGDGSVRFVTDKIDPQILKTLATPNGGESLGEF